MAKKKGASVSPFVPVEEQPYSIPENWCWVKLSALSSVISKGTTPTGGKDAYIETGINFVRVENLNDDGTISHEGIAHIAESVHTGFLKRSILQENDILISIAGTLGKTGIVRDIDLPLNTNQALAFVRIPFQKISKKYIKNAIDSTIIQEILLSKTKVTSIPNLTLEIISNCPIPLAPVSEQQRIVDRIESLFAKLDEAKEKAQSVMDGFELRKSAILHKAFTGELTERWRKEHGVGLDSWAKVKLIDVLTEKPRNGYSPKPVNYSTPYKSMTLSATTSGVFKEEHFKYIDETIPDDSYLWLKPGDILIQRANSLDKVGTSAIYTGREHEFIYPDLMMKLQVVETASPLFVAYSLKREDILAYFRENATGTAGNMPKINQKIVSQAPLNLPTLDEQIEIVRILESLFVKAQQAKEAAEAVLNQIDTMKKAILARAFRGELGTNDPAEEWAGELVKVVL